MNEGLTLNDIPQGVIDDLNLHYGIVTFDLDGDPDSETTSFKSNYSHQISDELVTETVAINPDTYEPIRVPCNGHYNQTYIVRLNVSENEVIVKRVLEAGIIVKPAE